MRNPVVVALGGIFGALVIAAAAGLMVDGGVLQAGGEHDLVCDEDGVTVQFDKDDSGLIAGAKIEGIDADCFGASLKFDTSAPDEGGPFFVGSIAASSYSFPFSSLQEESDVGDFSVAIFGSDSEVPNEGD
jgi:hypothetical protein